MKSSLGAVSHVEIQILIEMMRQEDIVELKEILAEKDISLSVKNCKIIFETISSHIIDKLVNQQVYMQDNKHVISDRY